MVESDIRPMQDNKFNVGTKKGRMEAVTAKLSLLEDLFPLEVAVGSVLENMSWGPVMDEFIKLT